MGLEPNGYRAMRASGVNLYALVIYLPDPLRSFLDELRLELVPGCNPNAHVSVLPPRPLPEDPVHVIDEARHAVANFSPFEIELGRIERFPVTDVIYISVESGAQQLHQLHDTLNNGALAFDEPYIFHPHVTLAQEVEPDQLEALRDLAERRWNAFEGHRTFRAERTVFVRNTQGNRWVDLMEGPLRALPVR